MPGPGCSGRGAERVDDAVVAIGCTQMGETAAQNTYHHGLDDREREEGCHGCIDCVAAFEQHLGGSARCKRVVGDHHPSCTDGGTFTAFEPQA